MSVTATQPVVTLAELVEAIRDQRRPSLARSGLVGESVLDLADRPAASAVVVVGAHPGGGASTVSVAIAEAIADRGGTSTEVRLVDGAPRDASGLICAADRELGPAMAGWRTGRRGPVEVVRADGPVRCPQDFPGLSAFGPGWLVVDAGWPLHDLLANRGPVTALLATSRVALVCRASVPGVRRMERALRDLAAHHTASSAAVPVVVGARRLPGEVRASFGPLLREASDSSRLVLVPTDRRLEVTGIEPRPLPKPVAAAARRLLDVIESDAPPTPESHRSPSRGRG